MKYIFNMNVVQPHTQHRHHCQHFIFREWSTLSFIKEVSKISTLRIFKDHIHYLRSITLFFMKWCKYFSHIWMIRAFLVRLYLSYNIWNFFLCRLTLDRNSFYCYSSSSKYMLIEINFILAFPNEFDFSVYTI